MDEDDTLHVFSEEDDWLLVRIEGKGDMLGFVPKTYCDPIDASHGVAVPDAPERKKRTSGKYRKGRGS